jgi:hypothetical protein
VAVLVGLIWNYLMYKHVVFRLAAQRDPVGTRADDEPPTALLDPTE